MTAKLKSSSVRPRAIRAESFGAIAQLVRPRALVFVDRDFATELGVHGEGRWSDPEADGDVGRRHLSAPLEAHIQLTNQCGAGCKGCYTGANPHGSPGELGLDGWKRVVDELADRGVFHLALGGGESAILPWLGDIAEHARSRGLVPNLTTSGLEGLERLLPITDLFGQINVSLDGLGDGYARVRGFDGFARADDALVRLRARKREVGINVVVTRSSFGELDGLFRHAKARRLNEIELLRFKPSGRGASTYREMACSDAQHRSFLPTIQRLARRQRIRVRVDCSYVPMLAHHRPPREVMEQLAVYGCTGGDFLVGAKATGTLTACSFAPSPQKAPPISEMGSYWDTADAFPEFRAWRDAQEPCRSCDYLDVCRGGCRVVSAHVAGSLSSPDPECPRVVDFRATEARSPAQPRRRLPVVR